MQNLHNQVESLLRIQKVIITVKGNGNLNVAFKRHILYGCDGWLHAGVGLDSPSALYTLCLFCSVSGSSLGNGHIDAHGHWLFLLGFSAYLEAGGCRRCFGYFG